MTRAERRAAWAAAQDDAVAAIVDTYGRRMAAQDAAGRAWYPAAGAIIAALAVWSGMPAERVAAALAALSPRNPWRWNVADAAAFAWAAAHGAPRPTATTFEDNRATAWRMLTSDAADWLGDARKVRAFVRAMLGDAAAVVVDVWAVRAATRGRRDHVTSVGDYDMLAGAYARAAAIIGDIAPRDLQAVVWLVAQSEAPARSTSNGRRHKAGTADIVRQLVPEEAAA